MRTPCWSIALVATLSSAAARAEFLPYSDPMTKNSANIETPVEVKVDGRMGAVSYSVSLVAPPGTGGLTPSFALVYSSLSGAGPYGWGWQLSGLSVVERSTRHGPPGYGDLNTCESSELVEIDGELLTKDPLACAQYHKVQSDFSKIVYDAASDSWSVTRTDGMRMLYGSLDAATPSTQSRLRNKDQKTFRWALDQVIDARGNSFRIGYLRATALVGGVAAPTQLYPERVSYSHHAASVCHPTPTTLPGAGKRLIQFEWEPRQNDPSDLLDRPTNYRAGFRVETAMRLKRVLTGIDDSGDGSLGRGTGGDQISAQYDLSYAPKVKQLDDAPYVEPTSKLVEVRRIGANGEVFPSSSRFEYAEPPRRFASRKIWSHQSGVNGAPFFPTLDAEQALFGDFSCETKPREQRIENICHFCVFNFATCTATDRSGCCNTEQNDLYRSSTKFVDMNGDAIVDRVRIRKSTTEWEMCPGIPGGQGFGPCTHWLWDGSVRAKDGLDYAEDSLGVLPNVSIRAIFDDADNSGRRTLFGVHADLLDLDGDGLPDRIEDHYYCDPGSFCPITADEDEFTYWSFHRNTGSGFERKRAWRAPENREEYTTGDVTAIALYEVDDPLKKSRSRSRLVDVNGDGKPDHMLVDRNRAVRVSINNGEGFDPPTDHELIDLPAIEPNLNVTDGEYLVDREFLDMNGDGLPDQILSGGSLGGSGPPADAMEIRFNTGRGFQYNGGTDQLAPDPALQRFNRFGSRLQQTRKRGVPTSPTPSEVVSVSETFADYNGDGVLDRVVTNNVDSAQGTTSGTIDVYYGLGDGTFVPQSERWPMPEFRRVNGLSEFLESNPGVTLSEMIDINGDGFMDRVGIEDANRYADIVAYLHPGPRGLLTRVINEYGGSTKLDYQSTTPLVARVVPFALFSGAPVVPEPELEADQTALLRRPMWVLSQRSTSDGRGTTNVEAYSYAQPRYDWGRRETVGMRASELLDQKGLLTRSVYFQSRALRGRQWFSETIANGDLLSISLNGWTAAAPLTGPAGCLDGSNVASCKEVPGSSYPEPTRQVLLEFDKPAIGGGTSNLRAHVITREFDERFGHLESEIDYGALGPDNAENTPDDPKQDDLKTVMGYAPPNLDAWLVSVPVAKATFSNDVVSGFEFEQLDNGAPSVTCGLVTTHVAAAGTGSISNVQQQRHDEFGNVIEARTGTNVDLTRPPNVRADYDARFKTFVSSSTNSLGHVTRFQNEPRWGNLVKVLGPNGDLGCREFDGFGRLAKSTRRETPVDTASPAALSSACETDIESFEYVSVGVPDGQYLQTTAFSGRDRYQSRKYFDGMGRTYKEAGGGLGCASGACTDFFVTTKGFDAFGREVCSSLPLRANPDGVGACATMRHRKTDYDILNRPKQVTLSASNEVEMRSSYAILDLDGDGSMEWVTTDNVLTGSTASGSATPAPTRVTRRGMNLRNQLVAIEESLGNGEKALTRFSRDAEEQLVKIDGPDIGNNPNQLLFTYDLLGRRTQMARPRVADSPASGPIWKMSYDGASHVVRKTSARGQEFDVVYRYDALDRLIGEDLAPFCPEGAAWASCMGSEDTNYVYDSFLGVIASGRLLAVGSPGPTGPVLDLYGYNHRGERIGFVQLFLNHPDAPAATYTYGYDRQSRIIAKTYPDGEMFSWQYDGSLLGSVSRKLTAGATSSEVLADQMNYHRSGALAGYRLPQAGIKVAHTYYDKNDRLQRIESRNNANQILLGLGFQYDTSGNIQTIDRSAESTTVSTASTQSFDYEALHRIARASDTRPASFGTQSYAYLPPGSGNLRTLGSRTLTYGENNADPAAITSLVDSAKPANNRTYEYDPDGNMTERVLPNSSRDKFTWNSYGRLTRYQGADGTTAEYFYDSTGDRLSKKVRNAAGEVVVDRLKPSNDYEVDLSGKTRQKHLFLADSRALTIESNGVNQGSERARLHYQRDHLGTPIVISDAQGRIIQRTSVTPYGEVVSVSNGQGTQLSVNESRTPYLFTSFEFDRESGLHYAQARYYDPTVGRFLSYDPAFAARAEGGSQELNPYSYVDNRPTLLVDPSGTWPSAWGVAKAAGGYLWAGYENFASLTFGILPSVGTNGGLLGGLVAAFAYDWNSEYYYDDGAGNISHTIQQGAEKVPFFLNGILTAQPNARGFAREQSGKGPADPVQGFHNASYGLAADVIESFLDIVGYPTPVGRGFANALEQTNAKEVYVHSQGAAIASNAARRFPSAFKDATVTPSGGAANNKLFSARLNEAGGTLGTPRMRTNDLVPMVLGMNATSPLHVVRSIVWAPALTGWIPGVESPHTHYPPNFTP